MNVKHYFHLKWHKWVRFTRINLIKCKELLKSAYLKILPIIFVFKYLIHKYDYRQFNLSHLKHNLLTISTKDFVDWLQSDSQGRLSLLKNRNEKVLWSIKNILTLGARRSRLKKVIHITFLAYLIELTNPFDKQKLKWLLSKKLGFVKRSAKKVLKINGKHWESEIIDYEMSVYEKRSLLQLRVIQNMMKAIRKKDPPIILEVKQAIKKGIYPLLIVKGCSGSYWMRNLDREILGLFKPFDEEIHAPNNPVGPRYQGALGERRTRPGVQVGESCHREVAAYLVDQFFGFGIVPRTYYASFSHHVFFDSREDRYGIKRTKEKFGSFQEFVEGFQSIDKINKEEQAKIAVDEFQLLIFLDVIIGNTDRNTGNFLVRDEKIAAIDHGLSFPDIHAYYTTWYWSTLSLGKLPFLTSLVQLLENFPFEELSWKLKKRCFISPRSIARMRERVVLFHEGIKAGLNTPALIAPLMNDENLSKIKHYDQLLRQKAQEIVLEHLNADKAK